MKTFHFQNHLYVEVFYDPCSSKTMHFAHGVEFLINLVRLVSWEKEIELMDSTSLLTSLRSLSCTALQSQRPV